MIGRHLGDDLGRELDGLPKALQSRAPCEIPPVQDMDGAVDQVGGDGIRDGLFKRLVEEVFGAVARPWLHHRVEPQDERHLVRRRLAVG